MFALKTNYATTQNGPLSGCHSLKMIQGEQECFFCFLKISRVGVFLINGQTTQSLCGRPKKTLEKKQKTNSRTKTKRKLASLDDKIKKSKGNERKRNLVTTRRFCTADA